MKSMQNFRLAWQLIPSPELSSRAAGEFEKFAWRFVPAEKRGGARVIYYWAIGRDSILLLFAYSKKAPADLTPKQVAQLAKVAKEELCNES